MNEPTRVFTEPGQPSFAPWSEGICQHCNMEDAKDGSDFCEHCLELRSRHTQLTR